ncbi:MAG TPA: sigma-70 family RNA polymerase sigma factor [Gemmatimonadetes bacterium]|nr:sigma-70 family RNA polymerase sigma factor [Gemmatimonadota bacterium]
MGIRLLAQYDSDASILEGCRRGDAKAQRCVFERCKDRVFSVALGFLKGDHAAAEDVTQEVFVKVLRAARTFRHDARLSTWLRRITVNACTDELRRRKRLALFAEVPPQLEGRLGPELPRLRPLASGSPMLLTRRSAAVSVSRLVPVETGGHDQHVRQRDRVLGRIPQFGVLAGERGDRDGQGHDGSDTGLHS